MTSRSVDYRGVAVLHRSVFKRLPFAGLLLLIAAPLVSGCLGNPPPPAGVKVGNPAPEIEGTDVTGRTIKLSDFRSKVVVIDFLRSGEPACRMMNESEKEMVKKFEGRPFALLGISVEADMTDLREYLQKEPITWPNIYAGAWSPLIKEWGAYIYPTLFVVDAKGVLRGAQVKRVGELEMLVEKLLREAESGSAP
jgi:peroxiredoxin